MNAFCLSHVSLVSHVAKQTVYRTQSREDRTRNSLLAVSNKSNEIAGPYYLAI